MSETEPMNFDDSFADAIRSLELAPLQTPVEDICYAAGFEAGRKRAGMWQKIAAMILLAAGGMVVWDHRPARPSAITEIVRTDDSKLTGPSGAAQTFSPVITAANLRLRQAVLSQGWDALPPSAADDAPPPGEALPPDPHLRRT